MGSIVTVDPLGTAVIGLLMLVGLVGVLVPALPGLLLIWAAGLAWVLLDGGGPGRWVVLAALTALALAGSAAPYVLSGRCARGGGAPWTTLAAGVVGMVVGALVIPVAGLPVGGVAGIWLAELSRLRDRSAAWASTVGVLRAVGIGILVELVAGVLMLLTWLAGVALT